MSTLSSDNHKVALITGTSGNLGTNIAKRLIKELDPSTRLTIIVTSRNLANANTCIKDLEEYAHKEVERTGIVDFDYLLIDFTNMVSVLNAVYEVTKTHKKIDYLFLNAAQGTYGGINWFGAIWECCTNPIKGVTYPTYKIQRVGVKSKDGLGLVFQVNVFAPYFFVQRLCEAHILRKGSKVVWISSVMSKPEYLELDDLQLIKSPESYEGSKRLVDLVHLGTVKEMLLKYQVSQYLVHPGIFSSFSFFQYLNPVTFYGMLFLFYVARFMGSPWHNIDGWKAANSCIAVTLDSQSDFDAAAELKYGSATKWNGEEYIKTEKVDPTGVASVMTYINTLKAEWDEKLKHQIIDTRQ